MSVTDSRGSEFLINADVFVCHDPKDTDVYGIWTPNDMVVSMEDVDDVVAEQILRRVRLEAEKRTF